MNLLTILCIETLSYFHIHLTNAYYTDCKKSLIYNYPIKNERIEITPSKCENMTDLRLPSICKITFKLEGFLNKADYQICVDIVPNRDEKLTRTGSCLSHYAIFSGTDQDFSMFSFCDNFSVNKRACENSWVNEVRMNLQSGNLCEASQFSTISVATELPPKTKELFSKQVCNHGNAVRYSTRLVSDSKYLPMVDEPVCHVTLEPNPASGYGTFKYRFCFEFRRFNFSENGGGMEISNPHSTDNWKFNFKLVPISKRYCSTYETFEHSRFQVSVGNYSMVWDNETGVEKPGYHSFVMVYHYQSYSSTASGDGINTDESNEHEEEGELSLFAKIAIGIGVIVVLLCIRVFVCRKKSENTENGSNIQAPELLDITKSPFYQRDPLQTDEDNETSNGRYTRNSTASNRIPLTNIGGASPLTYPVDTVVSSSNAASRVSSQTEIDLDRSEPVVPNAPLLPPRQNTDTEDRSAPPSYAELFGNG